MRVKEHETEDFLVQLCDEGERLHAAWTVATMQLKAMPEVVRLRKDREVVFQAARAYFLHFNDCDICRYCGRIEKPRGDAAIHGEKEGMNGRKQTRTKPAAYSSPG